MGRHRGFARRHIAVQQNDHESGKLPARATMALCGIFKRSMQEAALRSVLLIKAIEEVDRAGTLVPLAERLDASRDARRQAGNAKAAAADSSTSTGLASSAQRMLAARADALLAQVIVRHPFVATLKAAAGGPAWVGWSCVLFGALFGFFLSALDGTQRINIIAPGLIGLALWTIGV